MENKRKHLELIQQIISRMGSNLFLLRGWTITLFTAIFALFVKDLNFNYVFILYLLVLIFWILDGYFLSQERLFRALYNKVRSLDEKDIDFSMDINIFKKEPENGWMRSIISPTILIFYIPLILVILAIPYLLNK